MKSNKSTIFWVGGVLIIAIGLLVYPKLFSKNNAGSTDVPCLVPNLPLVMHIHPQLTILVDGVAEVIPAGIGLGACERAIHTHDEDAAAGVIHVESQTRREYTLGDFFSVWGKSIEREGYILEVKADNVSVVDPESIIFQDEQLIEINYITPRQ